MERVANALRAARPGVRDEQLIAQLFREGGWRMDPAEGWARDEVRASPRLGLPGVLAVLSGERPPHPSPRATMPAR